MSPSSEVMPPRIRFMSLGIEFLSLDIEFSSTSIEFPSLGIEFLSPRIEFALRLLRSSHIRLPSSSHIRLQDQVTSDCQDQAAQTAQIESSDCSDRIIQTAQIKSFRLLDCSMAMSRGSMHGSMAGCPSFCACTTVSCSINPNEDAGKGHGCRTQRVPCWIHRGHSECIEFSLHRVCTQTARGHSDCIEFSVRHLQFPHTPPGCLPASSLHSDC